MFNAKDFIETAEGLVFAVVGEEIEQGRILCFLRYVKQDSGWKKYLTGQANDLLKSSFPGYLYYSPVKDVHLHAVPVDKVLVHYQPGRRLQELKALQSHDPVEQDCIHLCKLYQHHGLHPDCMGVTGSLLIGAQNRGSDIDLVIYGRANFQHARSLTRQLVEEKLLQPLAQSDWLSSFERRACALSFDEYFWHERRKFNKALVNKRKFDLALLNENTAQPAIRYEKQGKVVFQARVTDASGAYDYPAQFSIDHPQIASCVCYTATYAGQAVTGEKVEISGLLERSSSGDQRVMVGSSREAEDQYIKVIAEHG